MSGFKNNIAANLTDNIGNPIASHITTDGDYHLGTLIQQDVQTDDNNSSEVNLDAAAIFQVKYLLPLIQHKDQTP